MASPNFLQVTETNEVCPRCDMIFSMLETDPSGERVQHIEMVERGEGFCFVVRILPFDPLVLHSTRMRCSCPGFRKSLRRRNVIEHRNSGGLHHTDYIEFSCASFLMNRKLLPKVGIDGRAANSDITRSTSADTCQHCL